MCVLYFFFFKQKTAYEMRISDWSSDVCSSDLRHGGGGRGQGPRRRHPGRGPCRRHRRFAADVGEISGHALGNGPFRSQSGVDPQRSEERRVGKECAVRVDLGGRRIIQKKTRNSRKLMKL